MVLFEQIFNSVYVSMEFINLKQDFVNPSTMHLHLSFTF